MAGFLSLYEETDRIELGGGWYIDILRYLSDAAHAHAQSRLVDPRIESRVADAQKGDSGEVRAVTTTVDQDAYHRELLAASIVGWNLTDAAGEPLPLPPYVVPRRGMADEANRVRRESIGRLPAFATRKVLAQILANQKRETVEQETFPEPDPGGSHSA